ncbi:MAG: acyl-CoA dehydrogenase [Syntrophaceae bacterium]
MANVILDERDQKFVLYEMLGLEKLCEHQRYAEFSRETFDMILAEAQKFAVEEILPTLKEADKEGCRLEKGQVHVPTCFHRIYKLFCEAGWNAMGFPPELGGQGLPHLMRVAANDWFLHNFAFMAYPGLSAGAAHLIEVYGTQAQKATYLGKMVTGEWAGTMCLTEPGAGTDVGSLMTKAVRQSDGTFRIQGTKIFITSGDHDLTENIIHPVLARIEGDPAGTKGISIFLVPKFLVNVDGSLGRRNDFEIANIEEKMGIHGSSTCLINFGDNGECYGELLGEEREGMKVMFQMMNEARIGVGMQGLTSGSIAYLHALQYAKERLQGASLMNFANPDAPRVPIIQHADIRRMLLWMKAHVEAMRAFMYFASYCGDRAVTAADEAEVEKWTGIFEVLTPVCKAYCSDVGFMVTNNAMQIYGGYGYCAEYPVEQFMRDEKIACIYEGANGIQALDLVGRKLGMKKGANFMALLGEMNATIARYQDDPTLADLAGDTQAAVNALADMAVFFARSAKAGKFMIPVGNAYPFLTMMGRVVSAWFLFWQAGIAQEKLSALCAHRGVDRADAAQMGALNKSDRDAAYYSGKLAAARYFIKHELPMVDAAVKAIKSEDLSIMDIADESFVA